MKKVKSDLPLNYITIKTTQSRINKGLLAIPVSLIDLFPKNSKKIYLVDEFGNSEQKTFTPYSSSSRECRIGGLKSFYNNYKIKDGEELVILILDDETYRIMPEKVFQNIVLKNLSSLRSSKNDDEALNNLNHISKITNLSEIEILKNEFVLLSKKEIEKRGFVEKQKTIVKQSVPYSIRKILLEIYLGKCQVTNFTFLTKRNKPYFELHHINPALGNHLKNLLVVSPNTHAQFTHSNLEQFFDDQGWLRKVKFNDDELNVFQIIDKLPKEFNKEIHD